MSENKICDAIDHRWLEEYYGYKCENCGSFVPYGCEPWVGDEAAQQSFAADVCTCAAQIIGGGLHDTSCPMYTGNFKRR